MNMNLNINININILYCLLILILIFEALAPDSPLVTIGGGPLAPPSRHGGSKRAPSRGGDDPADQRFLTDGSVVVITRNADCKGFCDGQKDTSPDPVKPSLTRKWHKVLRDKIAPFHWRT